MKTQKVDLPLAISVTVLLMGGMVMVFSASSMMANTKFGSLTYFFQKQMIWSALSLLLMMGFSVVDYRKLKKHSLPLIGIVVTILLLAGLFAFGVKVNGARRWYSLGLMNFQPSEFAKLALILHFAYYLSSAKKNIRNLKEGLLPLMAILFIVMLLIMMQPDLSTSLMLAMICGSLLLVSQAKITHLAAFSLPVIPALILLFNRGGYQLNRLWEWIAGLNNPMNAGYQIKQSLIGLGRGGWFGVDLGHSKQKFFFLPDSHTDFIFSIIGEEFGFIGVSFILGVFMFILYRGLHISRRVPDTFGKFLAIGITLNIVLYALINAAVVSMLIPATGLPMPFISYGGSHLLFLGVATGILLNISRHTHPLTANYVDFKQNRDRLYNTVITVD